MKPFKLIASIVGVLVGLGLIVNGYAGEKTKRALDPEEQKFVEAGLKPFEPKLLWEKKFKEQVCQVDVAKESGDVIVSTSGFKKNLSDTVYLFDKTGKVLWRQGPMEKIHKPWNAHISDKGQIITYDMIDWNTYFTVVFYVDRNNKEWWHKAFPGASHLSPDGSWVVVAPSGGTGKAVIILNDKEEVVLNKEYYWAGGAEVRFSENSQYVAVMDTRYVYDQNIYWIFDRQGNIVLEFKKEQGDGVKAFAVNGLFSVASMVPESIYNLKGEKIITGHRTTISGDGKVAIKKTRSEVETKLDVIKVAALKTLKSYHMPASSYKRDLLKISFNGRYIVLGPHDVYSSKVIVLDIVKGLFWKVDLVVPHYTIVSEQSPNCPWSRGVFFTKDEKYMVVHVIGENAVHTIQYYQLR